MVRLYTGHLLEKKYAVPWPSPHKVLSGRIDQLSTRGTFLVSSNSPAKTSPVVDSTRSALKIAQAVPWCTDLDGKRTQLSSQARRTTPRHSLYLSVARQKSFSNFGRSLVFARNRSLQLSTLRGFILFMGSVERVPWPTPPHQRGQNLVTASSHAVSPMVFSRHDHSDTWTGCHLRTR